MTRVNAAKWATVFTLAIGLIILSVRGLLYLADLNPGIATAVGVIFGVGGLVAWVWLVSYWVFQDEGLW